MRHPIIAKMFFRIDVNEMSYQRKVYGLSDFISDIGGIHDMLIQVAVCILGGYFSFHSSIETMTKLYNCDDHHQEHEEQDRDHDD